MTTPILRPFWRVLLRPIPSFTSATTAHAFRSSIHTRPLLLNACKIRQSAPNQAFSGWKRFVTTESGGGSHHHPKKNSFPILPIVAIVIAGSGVFYFMVKQREGNIPEKLRSKERG